mmetsp:Transcript_50947/g.104824  ORF Transcript_50947/g.104824 Transcript_50947/m.104824 type:complete len:87 (-) Transcript_50947:520-780(-)
MGRAALELLKTTQEETGEKTEGPGGKAGGTAAGVTQNLDAMQKRDETRDRCRAIRFGIRRRLQAPRTEPIRTEPIRSEPKQSAGRH